MAFHVPGMGAPPVLHQPPQVFGPYGPDGFPMQHLPPGVAPHLFPDGMMMMEDPNEAKRRRIAKACDMCRKKKIKCDGKMPACSHCINYKTECNFTHVEKKRQPPKGAKYIQGLENRLGRMEHLLRLSGLLDEDDGTDDLASVEKKLRQRQHSLASEGQASLATAVQSKASINDLASPDSPRMSPVSVKTETPAPAGIPSLADATVASEESKDGEPEEVEALSEMMFTLVTNHSGETRYIGVQWINDKTGSDSFQQMISQVSNDDQKWSKWKPEVFDDLFRRPIFRPLPSKAEALSLLRDFFDNFNHMSPLFHGPTFMHLVERQYSSEPYQGSGWWASLNVALAIAHRLRVMSNLDPKEEDEKAWGYLKNAMGVFSELAMRNTDLLSVQALLGMALFMQGTPNSQLSTFLIAAALRLSHCIGLHKKSTGFNLNPIEIEQRKRVFWIAYVLDKDLCLRSGRPPAQYDDDMTVELPSENPEDAVGDIPLADGKGKVNLFHAMCEFAVIEGKVYRQLYSATSTKRSDGELLNSIGELDQILEEWKDKIPIEFRPEHEIQAYHTPLIIHVVMLHFAYYNCLITIHRMSVHGLWTTRLADYAARGLNTRALNPRVYSSAVLCTAAARASISLLKYIPQGDNSCVWMILYFPVTALVTLFGNILQNPVDPRAKTDIRLMELVVNFLMMLGQEAEQGGAHRMLSVCSEFVRIAKAVVEKAEKSQNYRRKRKTQDGTIEVDPSALELDLNGNMTEHGGNGPKKEFGEVAAQAPVKQPPRPSADSMAGQAPTYFHNGPSPVGGHVSPHSDLMHAQQYEAANGSGVPVQYDPSLSMPMGWGQDLQSPENGDFSFFGNNGTLGYDNELNSPDSAAQGGFMYFQQPQLPQDLFAFPMNLDWNWAEMSGQAYPTVENGNFGEELFDDKPM